jgi:CheY-like chemotaxis protein/two-component sensor histidine kinase
VVDRNATAMAHLIEDLLDVSRIITGKLRLDIDGVDLVNVIESAVESIRPAADAKQIRVSFARESAEASVRGDGARLQQVVWNLLSNAVKFTAKTGRVDVVLRRVDSSVELRVSDSGRGIAPAFLPFVFDPFRQADGSINRLHGGLGLGLAITRQLVELHGGRVEAKSDGDGLGATFIVRLPLSVMRQSRPPAPAAAATRAYGPLDHPPELVGLHVLVVDDAPDARDLLQTVLERCGSRVTVAASAAAALAAIECEVPDVLLSDIGMPDENGFDLIRKVRALPASRGGNVPAAALTAYARPEDRREVLNAGYMMHVPKPVDPADLVAVVASLARVWTKTV